MKTVFKLLMCSAFLLFAYGMNAQSTASKSCQSTAAKTVAKTTTCKPADCKPAECKPVNCKPEDCKTEEDCLAWCKANGIDPSKCNPAACSASAKTAGRTAKVFEVVPTFYGDVKGNPSCSPMKSKAATVKNDKSTQKIEAKRVTKVASAQKL